MCSVRGSDSGAEAHSGDSAHLPAPVDALGPPEDTSCPSPGPEGSTPGPRSLTVCLWGSSLRTSFPGEAARLPWFSTCDRDVLSLADSNSAVGPGVMCPLGSGLWSLFPGCIPPRRSGSGKEDAAVTLLGPSVCRPHLPCWTTSPPVDPGRTWPCPLAAAASSRLFLSALF